MPSDDPPTPEPSATGNRRRSISRLKRLLFGVGGLIAFLVLALLIIAGPAFPVVARFAGLKAAAAQGISGDLRVEGSLFGGFSVREIELTGTDSPLTSLTLNEVTVEYRFRELLTAAKSLDWLTLVRIDSLDAELTIPIVDPQSPPPPEEKSPGLAPDEFSPVWNLLQAEVDIREINLIVHVGEESYELASLDLALSPSADGKIEIESILLPGRDPIGTLSTRVKQEERRLTIDTFAGREIETLQFLTVAEPDPGRWTINAGINIGDAALAVEANTAGIVSLTLPEQQVIDLTRLPLPEDGPGITGVISDLDLRFEGDFETPSSWQIDGKILGHSLGVDATVVDSFALLIADNQAHLDILAPGLRVSAKAAAPLDQLASTEDFASLPVDLSGKIALESAGELLSAWEIEAPVTGQLEATIENVQLVGGTSLRSGSATIRSNTITFKDHLIPLIDLTARVTGPDRLRLDTEIFPDDSGRTYLKGGGDFLIETLTYEGSLVGEFHPTGKLGAILDELSLSGTGNFRWIGNGTLSPAAHQGEAALNLADLVIKGGTPLKLNLAASYTEDGASVETLSIVSETIALNGTADWQDRRASIDQLIATVNGETAMSLTASVPLDPTTGFPFLEQPGEVVLDLSFSDFPVEEVFPLFSTEAPLAGRLNGTITNTGTWEALQAQGDLKFHPELEQPQGDPALDLKLAFGGAATRPETWMADLTAILSGLKYDELQLGDVRLTAATTEETTGKVLALTIDADQAGASIDANATLDLSNTPSLEALQDRPLSLDARVNAPDLATLWQQLAPPRWRNIPVAGAFSAELVNGSLQNNEVLDGNLSIFSDTLTIDGETLQRIDVQAQVDEPNHVRADLKLHADEISRVIGSGRYHLVEQNYDGNVDLALDLNSDGVLRRLLGRREIARLLPGRLTVTANGTGSVPDKTTSGAFQIDGGDLALADGASPITDFAAGGTFSETSLDLDLEVESDPLNLDGKILWDGKVLTIPGIDANSGGRPLLRANGSLPLTPETLTAETWFAQDGPIDVSVVSEPTGIETLMRLVNQSPPVNGTVDLDLRLAGSPALPEVDLSLAITDIALPEQDNLKVGAVDLTLATSGNTANLSGEYRHPDVNPLTLNASLPFFPKEWALKERDVTGEKLQLRAKMDRSSLSFLTTQVPAIKSIDGFLALDAEVSGTVKKPVISGDGSLEVSRLRFQDRNAPSLYDVELMTRFADNRLMIEKLKAIVAGGEVAANGSIAFLPGQEPRFDLQLGAREALIFRTPDLSVRTDAALTLTGPFSAATIAGELGLNNCRFFKNFDLLPQTLPVRNTSALPTVERTPRGGGAAYQDLNVGVTAEPFSNWNADVRLFTKTPFQVRSNLVESDLVTDIRVSGKLAAPVPTGFLAIDEGELSLPFSSIDVEIGRVEFDQQTGFNGALNFKAKAKADNYRINIYLHNTVLDPKFVLTSNPPLPSEDLMTLLVTGTTRDELIGGDTGSLAASKAATLLFKNMRKASAAADSEPTLLDDLQERTELEIGGVNPETGEQTIGGKVRLWKQLFFVGDVDAENDYRALLKYVFRFR